MREDIKYLGFKEVSGGAWHYVAEITPKRKYVYVRIYRYLQPVYKHEVLAELKIPKDKFDEGEITLDLALLCGECDGTAKSCGLYWYCKNSIF